MFKNFVAVYPAFYKKHRKLIKKRMSEMYFKFGYAYLESGKNLRAFNRFLKASEYFTDYKILKNILLSILPLLLRRVIKRLLSRKK